MVSMVPEQSEDDDLACSLLQDFLQHTKARGGVKLNDFLVVGVGTAPQLICKSLLTPAAALTALIVSPAACTSILSLSML
jgi:hypothetical protein